ncbi:MAG: SET domain-containing protein-lysine N-methyltransferase [Proteobacteria bacterium]|nr:SET domain-containing protein-lysine N-methyltransferase [Burkholderiales bacterium]
MAKKKSAKKSMSSGGSRPGVSARAAVKQARNGPKVVARKSPVHGRGMFALVDIAKGARIIEYKGRKITWAQADRWYADDDTKPSHTFLFTLDDRYVLDGNKGGNSARWINHSCKPNCESDIVDGRIWIEALRNIKAGEELYYDYNITLEDPHTPAEKRRWPCLCGNKGCRGTLLAKKR